MGLDLTLFSSKLRRYREQFALGPGEVCAATGIPRDRLAALENGSQEPTGDEVLILADFYKCDYKFFITNERLAAFEQTESLFRMHGNDLSKADRWAIQEFLFLCECEDFLMNNLPGQTRLSFEFKKVDGYYKRHGETAAAELRRLLGYRTSEIPRDVYRDFRKLGFHVFRRQLANSAISGVCIQHPTGGKCILINYSEDTYRQRFSVAHEAAHAILDDDKDFVVSFKKWNRSDLSEVRANTFASRYLLPLNFLKGLPEPENWTAADTVRWASQLMVNTEPLAIALNQAGLISDQTADRMKHVKVPAQQKKDPELPESLGPKPMERKRKLLRLGLSSVYVGLCFDAYEQGVVSAGRLAEMLLVPETGLSPIANLYGRSLAHDD